MLPSSIELIRFCKEVGMDLGLKEIKTGGDYDALVNQHRGRDSSVKEKLRCALNWWTDVHRIAAEVIEEAGTPVEFARDARLNFRWRRYSKVPVPQSLSHEVAVQWEAECDTGKKISVADARTRTRFKSEHQMREALRRFGCPSELIDRLSLCAVQKLRWLDKKWVKAQNRKRSAKRRASKSPKKISK